MGISWLFIVEAAEEAACFPLIEEETLRRG
jgi:hypothetical protein